MSKEIKPAAPSPEIAAMMSSQLVVPEDQLKRILELAKEQLTLEQQLDKNKEERSALNEKYQLLAGGYQHEGTLPKAMQTAGMSEFVMEDGNTIRVNNELGLPALGANSKHRDKVLAWLKSSGNGDIIKSEVKVMFGQGDERLKKVMEQLEIIGVPFENYETANAASFAALVREMIRNGEFVPMEELGIFIYKSSEVEVPKAPKPKKAKKGEAL